MKIKQRKRTVQSHRYGVALAGLASKQSSKSPPNLNVKHYKKVEVWLIL